MLQLKNLYKTINGQEILRGVSLDVAENQNVVIIGRSGGGKSVTLRHIIGLLRPDSGEVLFDGDNLTEMSEEKLNPYRRQIGMLFQNGALFDSFTVNENLAFPLIEQGVKSKSEIAKRVAEALDWVELGQHGHKYPEVLSGGMRKRVALARAAISRPRLMLYDEPTSGLDPVVSDSISKLILRLARKLKMSSIVVTHDMTSAYLIADRIDFLHEGKIYLSGTAEDFQKSRDPLVFNFVQGISEIDLEKDKL